MASARAPTDAHSGAGDAGGPILQMSSRQEGREVAAPAPEAQGLGAAPRTSLLFLCPSASTS